MSKSFVYINNSWVPVKAVYAYHDKIGFVKLNNIKVHDGTSWVTVEFPDGTQRLMKRSRDLMSI
jgi:hypothetical protein